MKKYRNSLNKRLFFSRLVISTYLVLFLLLYINHTVYAATDSKKPTLTVKDNATEYVTETMITVKATDASGIKEVKYAVGSQKTSYFKKYGTKLTLTKNIANVPVIENGDYTFYAVDKAGNTKLKKITISTIDTTNPILALSNKVIDQKAKIHVDVADLESGIASVSYVKGKVSSASTKWTSAKDITGKSSFNVTKSGNYTVKATDSVGNETISTTYVEMELKAVWVSYLEFAATGYTEESFTTYINTMFDNIVDLNMNAVVVQVRPFGDAMYSSDYFPWSKYVSGTQGVDPGFDPLEIMVKAAHERDLQLHAWLNPYRITTASTDLSKLSDDNPAKIWRSDKDKENDRNVLSFGGSLYYNPASKEVHELIVQGVQEIVENYDVDGIHFDDYFYPTLSTKYKTIFDATEYKAYVAELEETDETPLTIANWRRDNVNQLVKSVYSAIKEINPKVQFGISPHGNLSNLYADDRYYVDVKTWLSNDGYVDYICPQLYWSFGHSTCAYDDLLDQWISLRTNPQINVYAGIANYRAGSSLEEGWKDDQILVEMIQYGRSTGKVDGYLFFRYDFFYNKVCLPAVEKLLPVLAEK